MQKREKMTKKLTIQFSPAREIDGFGKLWYTPAHTQYAHECVLDVRF